MLRDLFVFAKYATYLQVIRSEYSIRGTVPNVSFGVGLMTVVNEPLDVGTCSFL